MLVFFKAATVLGHYAMFRKKSTIYIFFYIFQNNVSI